MLKLYNPHGRYIVIPTNTFIENFDRLTISYIDNEIFRIPKLNTFVEFADTWNGSKKQARISYVDYDLIVEEDDTEVLVNIFKKYNDAVRLIAIDRLIAINNNTTNTKEEIRMNTLTSKSKNHHKLSLRAVLRSGKYILAFYQKVFDNKKNLPQNYSKTLEKERNDFVFRFVASKECIVKKSEE